jgi:hypothetical protein
MSIPKVIHYCWFGGNPLPPQAQKCIRSWKKYCPDYEIIQWNESNFDIQSNSYMQEAAQAQKWAFVSDYARLKIIYEQGGVYLDTDVELVRSLDSLLEGEGFMGFQDDRLVSTGLGFGARKEHPLIQALLEDYDHLSFLGEDGSYQMTPCPEINLPTLIRFGLTPNSGKVQEVCGIRIYPPEYFNPKNYETGILKKHANTYSIHHYSASWRSSEMKAWDAYNRRKARLEYHLGPKGYRLLQSLWNRLKK